MWERCDQFAPRPPSRGAGRPCRSAAGVGRGDAAHARAHLARRRAHPQEQERACLALRPPAATASLALRQPPLTDGCHDRSGPPLRAASTITPFRRSAAVRPSVIPRAWQRCVGVFPRAGPAPIGVCAPAPQRGREHPRTSTTRPVPPARRPPVSQQGELPLRALLAVVQHGGGPTGPRGHGKNPGRTQPVPGERVRAVQRFP